MFQTDEQLATCAAAGDRAALEELLRRNFDRIHAVCRRVACNPDDGKDAAQEALITIANRIASFDGRSSFSTWVYRVATNAAIDEVRRRCRRPVPVEAVADTATPAFVLSPGMPAGGLASLDDLAARLDVDAALGRLHPDFRAPIVLHDLYGLDYATIAEILEVPGGTVRSRIHRGRAALRVLLGTPDEPSAVQREEER